MVTWRTTRKRKEWNQHFSSQLYPPIVPLPSYSLSSSTGVYSSGASSHDYVNYAYVGGSQNPRGDPVPQGALNFTMVLPDGEYQLKYM